MGLLSTSRASARPFTPTGETPGGLLHLVIAKTPRPDPDGRIEAAGPLVAVLVRLVVVPELPARRGRPDAAANGLLERLLTVVPS